MHQRVEVRVDRAQLVWVTLGVVVSLGLAFALGFVVGRRAHRIEPAAPTADLITQIDADKQRHDELTFYKKLTEPKKGQATAKAKTRAAADDATATPGIIVAESQPERAPTAILPVAPEPREPSPAPVSTAQAAPGHSLEKAVARARQSAVDVDSGALRAALADGPAVSGDYTVQVSAFQSLGEANAFSAGLERKGFKSFVVTSSLNGRGTWYRVRMGRFTDEETAKRARTLLAQADIPAWVLLAE